MPSVGRTIVVHSLTRRVFRFSVVVHSGGCDASRLHRFTSSTRNAIRPLVMIATPSVHQRRIVPPPAGSVVFSDNAPAATETMASIQCFVVEDSPVIRENLIATLEEMLPMQVVGSAEDESSALRWLREPGSYFDLLIIDIFLKSGSGLGVLRAARSLFPGRRLIVLSNYATPDMRRRCLELGADRVFDKSSELDELIGYCDELSRQPPP